MIFLFGRIRLAAALLAVALLAPAALQAATVPFQERNYQVTVLALGPNVSAPVGCDLIFVFIPDNNNPLNNQKYLCIPSDGTARGVYDYTNGRFYRVDRVQSSRAINAFNFLNSTLINLNGTFFQTESESPALDPSGISTLESYTIPLPININSPADIAILDDATLSYRTGETNLYEITRQTNSFANQPVAVPIMDTINVAEDFDGENGTLLLVQPSATDENSNPILDSVSAYFRDGEFFDQIVLENNAAIPGYVHGTASGIAYDGDTGDFYVIAGQQLIQFKVLRPTLTSVTPKQGPVTGGITVSITGANIPTDGNTIVFFDGIQADNIVVKSSSQIVCSPPPHAVGVVDITMTGTGIIPGFPVTLSGAFSYVNLPPEAIMSASPTQGASPLNVVFNVGSSFDPDGTIVQRVIDFGDGTSVTMSPDVVNVVTASHIYTGNSTYMAILTVTDDQGSTAMSTPVTITVGMGGEDINADMILLTLAMKIQPETGSATNTKDQIKMSGDVVFPPEVTPSDFLGGTFAATVNGEPVSTDPLTLDNKGQVNLKNEKLTLKLIKKKGTPAGTYTFTYTHTKTDLSAVLAPGNIVPGRVAIPIVVTYQSPLMRTFTYSKADPNPAVVSVKQSKAGAMFSLVRK